MKKFALVIATFALLCACKETIYTYDQFYENPQMTQEYVAKWENRKNANQDQLNLAKKAVNERRLEDMVQQYKAEGARLIQSRLDDELENAIKAGEAEPIEEYYFLLNLELADKYEDKFRILNMKDGPLDDEVTTCHKVLNYAFLNGDEETLTRATNLIRAKEGL
jgi:hypothetical protein